MSILKEILNILYLLSGIAIAVISFLALNQIKIAKKQLAIAKTSIETNSERDAAVFTAKQCDLFANSIIPKYSDVTNKLEEKGISLFTLPNDNNSIIGCEYSQWLRKNLEKVFANKQEIYKLTAIALNELEAFSIYFIHKICDINIAFLPIARTYVDIVETLSPMICFSRSQDNNAYSNILALYDIWKKKLEKEALVLKQKELYKQFTEAKKQASCIIEPDIRPIGLDEK